MPRSRRLTIRLDEAEWEEIAAKAAAASRELADWARHQLLDEPRPNQRPGRKKLPSEDSPSTTETTRRTE